MSKRKEVEVVALEKTHDVAEFDCGNELLNSWLRNIARQHTKKSISRTFVLVDVADPYKILGYYALNVRFMTPASTLAPALAKKLPMNVPGFTLGRLAVAATEQKHGYGEKLLIDAMVRARRAALDVGGAFLFVDAKDDVAASFYQRYGFLPIPSDPLTMCIDIAVMT
jgi:ribosomal protein S18 acetylase RimI-like enzyme